MYRSRLFTVVVFGGVLGLGSAAVSQCGGSYNGPVSTIAPTKVDSPPTTTPMVSCSSKPPLVGQPVPNFVEEALPSDSTFNAQAVGDQEMIDQTPDGAPGTFPWHDPQGGNFSLMQSPVSLSHDGRYVAFESPQSDLVPGDTNGLEDVFVRDRATGTTERVSFREDGTEIQPSDVPTTGGTIMETGRSSDVSISADGRYVAYSTNAALDPRDSGTFTNGMILTDVYLYDRVLHTTELVSADTDGNIIHGTDPTVSADGRYVLFAGPVDSTAVYVRDRVAGTTTLIYNFAKWTAHSYALSANGRFAVFPAAGAGSLELVVVDVSDGCVGRVDVTNDGKGASQGNVFQDEIFTPAISGDGRYIAFKSNSWNLIPGMTGPNTDFSGAFDMSTVRTYVRDLALNSTTMLSPTMVYFDDPLSISDDGNLVAQGSIAALGPGTLYDVAAGTAQSVGFPSDSGHLDTWLGPSSLSGDGRYLGIVSEYYDVHPNTSFSHAWVQRVR